MKEDTSSDSDYELIQSKCDLGQENEIENKNVVEKCYNGQNLEDGRKIGDYNIREKSIIDMLPTMIFLSVLNKMQITIRDYQGYRCCYEVKETDNVEILKAMVEFKTGITDRCSYRLVYGCKSLEDGHKIGDYNIRNMSTIDMFINMTELKDLVLQQGSNLLGVQSSLLEIEKNMGKKDNKDELELKMIELEEKTLLLEKEVKNKQRDPEELRMIRQVILKIIEEKFADISRSTETKIQQIKNDNSKEFASLKQIIQQKDELIKTIEKNYEEMLTLRQNINQANMKTNGIIQSIGMKLNEVDQDFGQKIQGLDQAMRKTDNKCKDLEDRIAKFDINGSDQLIKIEEFGKTLQNLIDEKAKEKEEKKLQHLQLLSIQTDLNKKIGDLRNEFFNLHHDQVEKIKKVDDLNVTTKNSVDSMKVELKFLSSSTFKKGSFVNIDNEWKVTTKIPCCGTKCVNTESPYGTCKSRNGF
uniref:Ubiquitin-like domain-containing protein n=1 Tax=Meloidogyne floridensis TaxID=298350 RepID=A0A915PCZ3_9BILA